jgi:hypothetical protein
MTMPRRVQLSRKKGWRKPPGAVNCARPGPLGNPFRADKYGRAAAVTMFADWLDGRRRPSQEAPELLRQQILARITVTACAARICCAGARSTANRAIATPISTGPTADMRAALYARFSSDLQDARSIVDQVRELQGATPNARAGRSPAPIPTRRSRARPCCARASRR